MRVAVVGGAGYIGAHVVLALKNHETEVFDNFSTGQECNINVPFTKGDLRNKEEVSTFLKTFKPDLIIHLAALKAAGKSMEDVKEFGDVNIAGMINLLNAMVEQDIKNIIFSSSGAVYGNPMYTPLDEAHPLNPANYYGYTKVAGEQLLAWYKKVHNIRYVALRYFNAAGYDPIIKAPEREPTNLLPILMEAVVGKRDHATIFGDDYDTPDGTCIRDYIHVTDLADAHVKAIDYLNNNEEGIFNLGTGKGTSVCECIDAALRLGTFTVITAKRRPGDPAIHYTDATRAQQELGWTPKYSDMDTILKSMHAVYKNRT